MPIQPSISSETARSRRRLGATLAISSAVLLAGTSVLDLAIVFPADVPVGGDVLLGLAALVPLLAVTGGVAARRADWSELWLVSGCLLLVGMVPFGLGVETGLVGTLVVIGQRASTLDRRWYEALFVGGLLVGVIGVGSALYARINGHVSVMVAVAGALTVGTTVSMVATAGPRPVDRSASTLNRPLPAPVSPDQSAVGDRPGMLARSVAPVRSVLLTRWTDQSRATTAITARVWPEGIALIAYSLVVCVLHFSGLAYGIYTRHFWWDLMTHTLSGAGVAAWLYLLAPAALRGRRRLFVLLPALVLLTGAGFEVYEFLFRGFYDGWSVGYYLQDTLVDMACNLTGAASFGLLLLWWRS